MKHLDDTYEVVQKLSNRSDYFRKGKGGKRKKQIEEKTNEIDIEKQSM